MPGIARKFPDPGSYVAKGRLWGPDLPACPDIARTFAANSVLHINGIVCLTLQAPIVSSATAPHAHMMYLESDLAASAPMSHGRPTRPLVWAAGTSTIAVYAGI